MKVCIAEKPSVAKEIAAVLGANTRRDGFFEGNGYQVTWTFGHLCTLKEPHDYDEKWKFWNLNSLPILPDKFEVKVINNSGVEKQFKTIETLVKSATIIINCGDAGQEGELIQRWVLKLAQCNKPVKRLWISSLTESAIKEGFEKLKDSEQFDKLYQAGSSRAIGDWLLGMNATRLFTVKFGQGKQVLSIGRVQTPTLALIVKRQHEINNFVPQTYWEIKTKYREVIFNSDQGKFQDKAQAEKIITEIKNEPFEVISIETKKAKEAPPRLFDLTALQVECNKKFGYSADESLKTVQSLYEKKLVSYPRVDTTYLSDDIFPKVPGILKSMRNYQYLCDKITNKPIKKSNKVFDNKKVTDHHAIIPTDNTASAMSNMEEKIYDLIARRFIAVFYPDCEVSNTSVMGQVKETEFKANGRQILEPGWRIVYAKDSAPGEEESDEVQRLPNFVKGETGLHEPDILEKQTQAPKPYTEATLLRAMETAGKQVEDEELRELMKENGIGRPSTRAAVIETLFKRNYIKKEKKNLFPTVTGMELIATIKNELLKSAELTGKWEYKLRQIEKGSYSAVDFLHEMREMVSALTEEVKKEIKKTITVIQEEVKKAGLTPPSSDSLLCPKCKEGKILKGKTAFGCGNFAKGCNFLVPFEIMEKKLTDKQITSIIEKGKSNVIKGFKINDEIKEGMLSFDSSFKIVFTEQVVTENSKKEKKAVKETPVNCPKCKAGEIIKGNSAFGCSNFKSGCMLRFPFYFNGIPLDIKLIGKLILKRKVKISTSESQNTKKSSQLELDKDFNLNLS